MTPPFITFIIILFVLSCHLHVVETFGKYYNFYNPTRTTTTRTNFFERRRRRRSLLLSNYLSFRDDDDDDAIQRGRRRRRSDGEQENMIVFLGSSSSGWLSNHRKKLGLELFFTKFNNDNDEDSIETTTSSTTTTTTGKSYDLGLGKNQPIDIDIECNKTSSLSLDPIETASRGWVAPTPVTKPDKEVLVRNKVLKTFMKSISEEEESESEEKVKKRVKYDLGRRKKEGDNDNTEKKKKKAVVETNDEQDSDKLRAALWDEEHFSDKNNDDNNNNNNNKQQQQPPKKSENIIQFEDIDLSIPPSVYSPSTDVVWSLLRHEAKLEAEREPLLVSFLHSTILNHPTLESSLAFHLANHLSSPSMIGTQIMSLIREALDHSPDFRRCLRADILAVRDRDPACTCLPEVFLYFKGFHALQTHRAAHYFWKSGREVLAHHLQSRVSQTFQIDIHPNATMGRGIMLDHGTGIVIGETATVGHNCSILHHVTLGGSGKKGLDRHPKVGCGVLLGAGASVLGNVSIGDGCQVGAGTLVIGDLPSHSVAVGVPAKIIGSFKEVNTQPSIGMNQLGSPEAEESIVTFETEGI